MKKQLLDLSYQLKGLDNMKYVKYLLMLTIVISLSGCKKVNNEIPLIIYNEQDPYIENFKLQIIENSGGKFSIKSYDSQNSQLIQNEIIDELIDQNPKVLIVNPVDRLGAYTIIEKAKEANIPVIFFNREPLLDDLTLWNYAFYVGALDAESAVIQGEMVVELFGNPTDLSELDKNDDGKIQVVILKGEQGHQAAEKRTSTIVKELEDYGYDIEYLSIEVCDWNRETANQYMLEFSLEHGDKIELVVSNNDAMAIGAIDALKANDFIKDLNMDDLYDQGNDKWIPVLGVDVLGDAIPYLEDGSLYGTVLNDSEVMAEAIVELAEAIINGVDPYDINFEIVQETYIWVEYKRYVLDSN